ncbi:myb-like protein A [Dorcoceras hygrometricum]|uniref:Myb-like protein A n=1 Tax=Dorcoceras hygrometricum TaxID=472368 RepID=A0A2Z7B9N1_9LAMI|nr:myb-like protein A [Dorcoceras hygrometricum]
MMTSAVTSAISRKLQCKPAVGKIALQLISAGKIALQLISAGNSKEQCTSWFDCKMF